MHDQSSNVRAPTDDGAAAHLSGLRLPPVALPSTRRIDVLLPDVAGRLVLYVYPMTGQPAQSLPDQWDVIPGARGCTLQAQGFRHRHAEIEALGAAVFGVSVQSLPDQKEARDRLHLPYSLLSDSQYLLKESWGLPTFTAQESEYYKRLTLIIAEGVVDKVFYPVFPPEQNAADVVAWLKDR